MAGARFNPRPAVTPAATSNSQHEVRAVPVSIHGRLSRRPPPGIGVHIGEKVAVSIHGRLSRRPPRRAVRCFIGFIKPFQSTAGCHAGRHVGGRAVTRPRGGFQSTAGCHAGRHVERMMLALEIRVSIHGRLSRRPPLGLRFRISGLEIVSIHGRLSRRPPRGGACLPRVDPGFNPRPAVTPAATPTP